jgi:hypothetical protein
VENIKRGFSNATFWQWAVTATDLPVDLDVKTTSRSRPPTPILIWFVMLMSSPPYTEPELGLHMTCVGPSEWRAAFFLREVCGLAPPRNSIS